MPEATSNSSVRQAVVRVMARYFLRHLEAELQKPDEVLCQFCPGEPVRAMTQEWIRQVRHEFIPSDGDALPAHNLFKSWREKGIAAGYPMPGYEETSYVQYNPVFLIRLRDLRDGTLESRQALSDYLKAGFPKFDFARQGYSTAFFLESESYMRELLRAVVCTDLPEHATIGDALVLEQSLAYQRNLFLYFQSVLETALADRERLLHEILPEKVAGELQRNGFVEPVHFPDAAVLFTDFESFSRHTAQLTPEEVIRRLNAYFTEFDRIGAVYGLEKIKTIGDSYMAVAGVPEIHADPARAVCDAALEMLEASRQLSDPTGGDGWKIRIGIHTGPLVAGVIGKRKFSYDVWGATVNFASRMESSGEPGRINVSREVHLRLKNHYLWEPRGAQPVKGLGTAEMYFLLGKR
jgi:class 3 adenylate cyclase